MAQFKNLNVTTSASDVEENKDVVDVVDWAVPPASYTPTTPPYVPTTPPPSWSNVIKFGSVDKAVKIEKQDQCKLNRSSVSFIPREKLTEDEEMDLITQELEKMDDLLLEQATSNSFVSDGFDEYDDNCYSELPTTWMNVDMINGQLRYSLMNSAQPKIIPRQYPVTNKNPLGKELFSIVIGDRGKNFIEFSDYTNLDCLTQQPRFEWTEEIWRTTKHPHTLKPKYYTIGPEKDSQKLLKTIFYNPYYNSIVAIGGDQRLRERVLKLIFFKIKRTDKFLCNR